MNKTNKHNSERMAAYPNDMEFISKNLKPPAWRVRYFSIRGEWSVNRIFSWKTRGGYEQSLKEAKSFRDLLKISDEAGATVAPWQNRLITRVIPIEEDSLPGLEIFNTGLAYIRWNKRSQSWGVNYAPKQIDRAVHRSFSVRKYGSKNQALLAAQACRDAAVANRDKPLHTPEPDSPPCRECGIFSASPDVTADVADANPIYRVVPTDIGDTVLDCREDEEECGNT